ncbi:uncharacterized protein [Rutidosis leptorrhynchoides]|uniref:uncharacterized protein n=1 Tax=Rutidosis leptorrhynchoides TaxID=125765 RepID=UPI003A9972B1
MLLALNTKNKKGFIDGTCKRSDYEKDDVLANQWHRCNSIILTWILTSISDELYLRQIFSNSSVTVWQKLKETYDKIDGSITFNLHKQINSLTQGGCSVSEYYHKLNTLWKQYDAFIKLPACVCAANADFVNHTNVMKLMQFLMGLDEVYQPIRSNLLMTDPLPSVKTAFAVISREESHRNFASHPTGTKVQNSAFVAKIQPNTFNNNNTNTNKKNLIWVILLDTLENLSLLQNNNNCVSEKSNESASSSPFTVEQISKLMSLINDKDNGATTSMNSNMSGIFWNNSSKFNSNFEIFFCNNMFLKNENRKNNWIIDSGANQHMVCNDDELFASVDVSNMNISVSHPNGTHAKIVKVGNIKINDFITLFNVLYIPEYCVNLLSVNKLTKSDKFFVGFNETNCFIQDFVINEVVGIGDEHDGLYMFKKYVLGISNNSSSCTMKLWHSRLGHPASQVLNILSDSLKFTNHNNTEPCDICHQAKQTREPFPLSEHNSLKLGDLLNLDLWGPYKVASKEGYKYFLTNQFNANVKVIRSDNGTEFVNTRMNVFCNSNEDNARDVTHDDIASDDTSSPEGNVQNQTNINVDNQTNLGETSESRRSSRPTRIPTKFNDYVLNSNAKYDINKVICYANLSSENLNFVSNMNKSVEPTCYSEACLDKNWVKAMNSEIDALMRNNTWVMVDLPERRKAIGSKWIYKIKLKASGEIDRYKARLVAKGFSQREGLDYDETFSPIVKMITVRCLITLAVNNDWPIYQPDVNNAFLYGEIVEDVYMKPPEGYFSNCGNKVCKLVKSLYGLKQAPRKWNKNLTKVLLDNDLGSKPVSVPIEQNFSCNTEAKDSNRAIENITQYQKLVGKGFTFVKSKNFDLKVFADVDRAKSMFQSKAINGYCVFIGDSLIAWKSKKQNVVARSSVESEYRCMSNATTELTIKLDDLRWLVINLKKLKDWNGTYEITWMACSTREGGHMSVWNAEPGDGDGAGSMLVWLRHHGAFGLSGKILPPIYS